MNLFPYIFLGWIAVGATWLYIVHRRRPGILADIEVDLPRPELMAEESVEIDERAPQPAMA